MNNITDEQKKQYSQSSVSLGDDEHPVTLVMTKELARHIAEVIDTLPVYLRPSDLDKYYSVSALAAARIILAKQIKETVK